MSPRSLHAVPPCWPPHTEVTYLCVCFAWKTALLTAGKAMKDDGWWWDGSAPGEKPLTAGLWPLTPFALDLTSSLSLCCFVFLSSFSFTSRLFSFFISMFHRPIYSTEPRPPKGSISKRMGLEIVAALFGFRWDISFSPFGVVFSHGGRVECLFSSDNCFWFSSGIVRALPAYPEAVFSWLR